MEFIKTLIHGKVLDTCSICLENIREKHTHTLRCKHQLHKTCYRNLIDNNIHRCPSCRADFTESFTATCQFCQLPVEVHKSESGTLKSGDCEECYFHYECFKRGNHTHCGNCNHAINPEKVLAISYLYFQNGIEAWVGQLQKCRHENCYYYGSPKRYGYCNNHNTEETMNKTFAKALEYMVRYTNIQDQQERYDTFYKALKFIDKKYEYTDYEYIVLNNNEIKEQIAITHSY